MVTDHDSDEAKSALYPWLTFAAIAWTYILVFAVLLDIGNGLNNFLHAPIGIKDNPPEPPPIVALAQETMLINIIFFFALRFLRWICKIWGSGAVFKVLAYSAVMAVFASALLARSRWHYEFIPGSTYLFFWGSRLFGVALLVGIYAFDVFMAWTHMKAVWDGEKGPYGSNLKAGVCFSISVLTASIAAIGFLIHWQFAGLSILLSIVTGLVGLKFAPKVEEATQS